MSGRDRAIAKSSPSCGIRRPPQGQKGRVSKEEGNKPSVSSYQAVLKTHSLQDAPMTAGRFPVIVYNSAWWGFRSRSTFMTQDLASHGFVVVAISHPYNSSMVELADGSIANPDYSFDLGFSLARYIPIQERFAMADEELAIQTADCRFCLDELEKLDRTPGHPLESRLWMDRVGAYGYSFGGAVSVELAFGKTPACEPRWNWTECSTEPAFPCVWTSQYY